VVILSLDNEEELLSIINKAEIKNIKYAIFREPDLNNAITSVVFEPGHESRRLSSSIKLMG